MTADDEPKKRKERDGIYKRGNVWWIRYTVNGKTFRESSGSARKSDARTLRNRRLGEAGRGRLIGPSAERVTFEDMAKLIEQDYRINRRKSVRRLESSLTNLRAFFRHFRALNITTDKVHEYIDAREKDGAEPATIQNELAALKRMFNLAVQADRLERRPYIPSLRVRNTREGFFEESDFRELLKHLPIELAPAVSFLYWTGWRKSEGLTLRWSQVDFNAGTVRLEPDTTKNDEGRMFPFAAIPELADLMQQQREQTDQLERESGQIIPWVFHRRGRPIRNFRKAWDSATEKAGVPRAWVHDFRRTAVRRLERAGVSRSTAMKLTGHKTESVFRRYAIVAEQDLREGVEKLARFHDADSKRSAAVHQLRPKN